jgi:hypothetical protein
MRLRVFLAIAVFSFSVISIEAVEPDGDSQAVGEATGERATLRGTVAEVVRRDSGYIFVNVGASFPDHAFAVWIHKMDTDVFPDVDSWVGKEIAFSGVVETYNEKPMLRIRKPADVIIGNKPDAATR